MTFIIKPLVVLPFDLLIMCHINMEFIDLKYKDLAV